MHPFVLATLTVSAMFYILALIYASNAHSGNGGLIDATANTGVALMAPFVTLNIGLAIVIGIAPAPFVGSETAAMFIIVAMVQVAVAACYLLIVASISSHSSEQEVQQS